MSQIPPLSRSQREWEFDGMIESGDVTMPQYSDVAFTGTEKQLVRWRKHIAEGDVAEAENEFHLFQRHITELGEEQMIRYRIECAGAAAGKCAVLGVHYDADGNKISQG